jgi:ribosomal protein S27AE
MKKDKKPVLPREVRPGDAVAKRSIKSRWYCEKCGKTGLQKPHFGFSAIFDSPDRCPKCGAGAKKIWSYMGTSTLITGDSKHVASVGAKLV